MSLTDNEKRVWLFCDVYSCNAVLLAPQQNIVNRYFEFMEFKYIKAKDTTLNKNPQKR